MVLGNLVYGTFPNASSYQGQLLLVLQLVMGSLVHMMDLCTCGNCLPVLSLAVYTISKLIQIEEELGEIVVYAGEEWRQL
eukprot:XP_010665385.1 PREDICTED: uncharacterized protein LOC104882754 isoform X3 [Vitis vinifera]